MSANDAHKNAIFDISNSKRPYITIDILGADNKWHPVRILEDTGNDITLITQATAQELGFTGDILAQGTDFKVQGIAPQPLDFTMINAYIRLKDTDPVRIKLGVGPLRDNLLGREDVLDNYNVLFERGKLTFIQLKGNGNTIGFPQMANTDGLKIKSHIPTEWRQSKPVFSNIR